MDIGTRLFLAWILWVLCGLIGGRLAYRRHDKLHQSTSYRRCDHLMCDYRFLYWAGCIGLCVWVLFVFHRLGMRYIERPTRVQRVAKLRASLEAEGRWCGNPLVHAGHYYGEMMDEWCDGRPRQYPVELEAVP